MTEKKNIFFVFIAAFLLFLFEFFLDSCGESDIGLEEQIGAIVISFVFAIIAVLITVIQEKKKNKKTTKSQGDIFPQYDTEKKEEDPFEKYDKDPFGDNK